MIVVLLVLGLTVALCIAGWVPTVRQALRADVVLPGPAARAAVTSSTSDAIATPLDDELEPAVAGTR